jgi:hypothetical protein
MKALEVAKVAAVMPEATRPMSSQPSEGLSAMAR